MVIEEFEKIGLDTARSVLNQDVADLVRRTDLEEENYFRCNEYIERRIRRIIS